MKRSALVLVGLAMLLFPRPASAGWIWAWFEDLSGPRFRGSPWNLRLICIEDSKPTARNGAAEAFASLDLTLDLTNDRLASGRVSLPGEVVISRETLNNLRGAVVNVAPSAFGVLERGALQGVRDVEAMITTLYGVELPPAVNRVAVPAAVPERPGAPDEPAPCLASRSAVGNSQDPLVKARHQTIVSLCNWRIYLKREAITASGSVLLSLCAAPGGGPRRVSIDLNFRSMSDADESRDKTLSFSSLSPAVTFHLLDPAIHKKWDFVDVGLAVGFFWVVPKDESLQAFSGVMVEPIRFDFHAPPMVDESSLWPLGIPYFQYGLVWFPTGFAPKSFAAEGPFSGKYPPEVIRAWSLYFNLTPVVRRVLPNVFGGVKR